jgi:hypothetical protein
MIFILGALKEEIKAKIKEERTGLFLIGMAGNGEQKRLIKCLVRLSR